MAYDLDREALRIYRDPMVPPAEKRRLLEELGLDSTAAVPSLTEMGAASGDAGGASAGWGNTNPEILAGNAALEADAENRRLQAEAAARQADKATAPSGNWLFGKEGEAQAPQPQTSGEVVAGSAEELPDETPPPAGRSPAEYRSALNRGVLSLSAPGGAAPKPSEQVREEVQVQQGSLTPEQNAEIASAEAERDEARLARERAAESMAQRAEQTRITAEQQVLDQRRELAELNARTNAEAQRVRARQNQISEEIASADIKQPSLWGDDATVGEKFLTILSVALFALGDRNGSGARNVEALANRVVDRQARAMAGKRDQINALGSIVERHYANFGDVEAAKKQAIVDILGKSELEVRKQALEAEKQGLGQAIPRLQELAAALKASRQEAEAERDKRLGTVIQTSAARQMVRERSAAIAPPTVAQPTAPGRRPMTPEQQRTATELDSMNAGIQAGLRGETPPPAAAPARAPGAGGPAAAPPPKTDALQRAFQLQREGKSDEAIAALPPGAKAALRALYKARKQDMGAGTTDADALNAAFQDLGMPGPETAELVPQAARERMVKLADGTTLYAANKDQANQTQQKIAKLDGTVGGLSKMLALSRKYKNSGAIPPAVKSEIEQLGNALMFDLSLAQEQGTVREAELPLYEKMVGSAIANYFKDPRYDLEAGLREIRRVFANTRQRLVGNLSPSATGEGAPRRAREVR